MGDREGNRPARRPRWSSQISLSGAIVLSYGVGFAAAFVVYIGLVAAEAVSTTGLLGCLVVGIVTGTAWFLRWRRKRR